MLVFCQNDQLLASNCTSHRKTLVFLTVSSVILLYCFKSLRFGPNCAYNIGVMASNLGIFARVSTNAKLGPISVTGAAQVTCPASCPFRGSGCYAENGPMGFHTRRLNDCGLSADEVIQNEATAIQDLPRTLPLRIHAVGDVLTDEHARTLADACKGRKAPAYTYTHSWANIAPESFGDISVLASCETPDLVKMANDRGYAAALVVDQFPTDKAYELDGLKILPCPNQTRKITCSDCGLCMRADKLRAAGLTIGFAAHGGRFKTVLRVLGSKLETRRRDGVLAA